MSTAELSVVSQSFGRRATARRASVSVSRVAAAPVDRAQRVSLWARLSGYLMQSRIDWATGGRELPRV
ncbi:MAG: hypothetical protein RJA98_3403 [Pseudomonadota bacterium]|jgi:hypothetical protein